MPTPFINILKKKIPEADKIKLIEDTLVKMLPLNKAQQSRLIHWAAENGQTELITYFVKKMHIDVDSPSEDGFRDTPFGHAISYGQLDTLKTLIALKANSNVCDAEGCYPIHAAAQNGLNDIVLYLVKTLAADVNLKAANDRKATPFLCAASSGKKSTLSLLLTLGADMKITDGLGRSALHRAISHNQFGILSYLVNDLKLNLREETTYKHTPLIATISYDNIKMFRKLIELGANDKLSNSDGVYLIHVAAAMGSTKFISELINLFQFDINLKTNNQHGITPSHYAARHGRLSALQMLIDLNGKPDLPSQKGWYPIHEAAEKSHTAIIRYLVKNQNIDVNQTRVGYTVTTSPLYVATQFGKLETIQELIRLGAKLGNRAQKTELIQFLIRHNQIEKIIYFSGLDDEMRLIALNAAITQHKREIAIAIYEETSMVAMDLAFFQPLLPQQNFLLLQCMLAHHENPSRFMIYVELYKNKYFSELTPAEKINLKVEFIQLAEVEHAFLKKHNLLYAEVLAVKDIAETILNKDSLDVTKRLPPDLYNHVYKFLSSPILRTQPAKVYQALTDEKSPSEKIYNISLIKQRVLFFKRLVKLDLKPSVSDAKYQQKLK